MEEDTLYLFKRRSRLDQGRINHSGPHANVGGGLFLIRGARIFSGGALLFTRKVDDLFSRRYV